MEISGRDLNLGLGYEFRDFKGTLGFSKVEQFFANEESGFSPRLFAGFSYNISGLKKETSSRLQFVITDEKTGDRISSSAIIQINGRKIVVEIVPDETKYITIKQGVYMVTLVAPGYKEKRLKVDARPGSKLYIMTGLTKNQETDKR